MKHELSNIIQSEVADFFAGFVEIHTELGGPNSIEEAQTQLSDRLCALLAAHEQEPVAWMKRSMYVADKYDSVDPEFVKSPEGWHSDYDALYTHPAPSIPSVADDYLLAALENHETFWAMREMELGSLSPEATMVRDVGLRAIAKAKAAPSIPAAVPDYFAGLVAASRVRADKAMRKYPQPNYVLNKVAEESGEVIKAVIHYTEGREEWANVEGEIIDNLAMLIRLLAEGDQVIGFTPPDTCRAAMLQGNSPVIPDGYVLVPIKPTEDMVIHGFESEPSESFSETDVWEAYEAMSGCQQAAHRAELCWAAMIAAAPKGV